MLHSPGFKVKLGDRAVITDKRRQGRRSILDLASVGCKKVAASNEHKRDCLPKLFEQSHAQWSYEHLDLYIQHAAFSKDAFTSQHRQR